MDKIYMCIDLKSFYASVECVLRGLDPLTTNLVVADESRTDKTICLAVSPSLKAYGLPGRARLYEVRQKVKQINYERKKKINYRKFIGKSYDSNELKNNDLELDFIIAPPHMATYMEFSRKIYEVYLSFLSSDDIFAYSIDEVFCDITSYLSYYKMTKEEFVTKVVTEVVKQTGITATAGIGTNLYLAKIAMDIVAKHVEPNKEGVRIAFLDEYTYRLKLWDYRPLTSFWRIGKGISDRLEKNHLYTMGDVARCSIENENLLYKLFGVNAELIIDHAWGYEPCTVKDAKSYKASSNSISLGQVMHEPYSYDKMKIIILEMADSLILSLVEKHLITNQIVINIGYDVSNLTDEKICHLYHGEIVKDHYGRDVPKPSHGSINLPYKTSSSSLILEKVSELFEKIINKYLLVRRVNIVANNVVDESERDKEVVYEQFDLFSNNLASIEKKTNDRKKELEENNLNHALLDIKKKYGKNAILKGINYLDGATMRERNKEVGGHHE